LEGPKCIFCEIVAGRAEANVVFEDSQTMAFLDARPVFFGHCLLVPKVHVGTLVDLPDILVEPLFGKAKMLASAVRHAMDADGTFVAMNNRVSQSVPHLHIHILPRSFKDGLRGFFWPRTLYPDNAAATAVKESIVEAIAKIAL